VQVNCEDDEVRQDARGVQNLLSSVIRHLTSGIDTLAIVTFTGMFLCVFVQVVLRYGFDQPLVWSDELARYLFVWCAFLGWIVAARHRSHLTVDVITMRFGPRGRAAFALIGAVAALAFAGVLFVYGVQITQRNADIETVALFFTFGVVYAIVPVTALAVGVYACADALTAWRTLRGATPP
jgi:TRAP-type transport system small permease protein